MKIIKKGYKTKPEDIVYVKKCYTCGCEFTYQLNDVRYSVDYEYVYCPDCKYSCTILFQKKYKPPQQNNFFTRLFRKEVHNEVKNS